MGGKATLLVVEDEVFTRKMMGLHLEKAGYRVRAVGNGREALDALEEQGVDMVLADVFMPEMDGPALLEAIRQTWSEQDLPVLMLTSVDDRDKIVEFFTAGANDCITKHKDPAVLLIKIKQHLELSSLRRYAQKAPTEREPEFREPNDGLWKWNLADGKIFFSPRWKGILGFQADELPDHLDTWFSRIHPADFERVSRALRAHQQQQSPHYEADYRVRLKGGNYHWVHDFGIAVFDRKEGRATHMVGAMSWILPRKEWERERKVIANELRVIRGLVHEITPHAHLDPDLHKAVEALGEHFDLLTSKMETLISDDD
ncbi:response regulator [Acanthopleuribacter pedis]|uniref:Response regulator n=1 Tax=Acanthopleuribacter pedis TaxID=442870 RepID=A0A8J7Q9M9_9BACT|nr:response regulator [Acanthopleuribacter pedis]MBO1319974.1 response regulator [Acanthopleuribacter pedis]